jgi:dGTPase
VSQDLDYGLRWRKFGSFVSDREAFNDARSFLPACLKDQQSIEASIMDIADDITYAIHDLEDFYKSGLLAFEMPRDEVKRWLDDLDDATDPDGMSPLEHLKQRLARDYPGRFTDDAFSVAARQVCDHLQTVAAASHNTYERQRMAMARQSVSYLITEYLNGIALNSSPPNLTYAAVNLDDEHWHQIQILKWITRHYVISRTDLALVQRGQQTILRELLSCLKAWIDHGNDQERLPAKLHEDYDAHGQRALIDFVAALPDHHAIAMHQTLRGASGLRPPMPFLSD